MTNHTTRFIASILCALALALPACGGEAKKADAKPAKTAKADVKAPPKTEVKKPEPTDKPEPVKAADPNAEKVKVAATVAREIAADPEHADDVLTRHGLDRAKLDAMMFEIAADPTLTEAYMDARRAS